MHQSAILAASACGFVMAAGPAAAQHFVTRLTPQTSVSLSNTEGPLAIDGDVAVIATWVNRRAFVFERNADGLNAWGQVKELKPLDERGFGTGVDLDGDRLIVGDSFNVVDEMFASGAVYVFEQDAGGPSAWGEVAKLTAPDPLMDARLGRSVAIDGDRIVAGAPLATNDAGVYTGAAYVFDRDAATGEWEFTTKLTPSSGVHAAWFGIGVGLSGDTIVVGANADEVAGVQAVGAAYVYRRDQSTGEWNESIRLTPTVTGQNLGRATVVDVDGDQIVVSRWDNGSAIFERSTSDPDAWAFAASVSGGDLEDSLTLDNGTLVARPDIGDDPTPLLAENAGGSGQWGEVGTLVLPEGGDAFGEAATKSGPLILIAGRDGGSGSDAPNTTYLYSLADPADLNLDGSVDGADLGLLLGLWGGSNASADLNDDGVVDGADLGLLLGAWTQSP